MTPSLSALVRFRPLLIAAAMVGAIVGCQQELASGLACPSLCPQQVDSLRDTTLYAVDYDTSVSGYPTLGSETQLELSAGKSFDLRGIVRFDTLQATFTHTGTGVDSDLVSIASAVMKMVIAKADTLGPPVTFSLYDVEVDTTENDTSSAALTARFIPANLIGQRTIPADSLKDSIEVKVDSAKLMAKILTLPFGRLRVGIQITAPQPTEVQVFTKDAGLAPFLFIRPSLDSTVDSITVGPYSKEPIDDGQTASELADFQLVSVATPPAPSDVIRVGGIPGRRGYLRFNIPTSILDSSAVIRASLILTQRPNPAAPDAGDTAGVVPFEIASSTYLTDIRRALIFISFGMDSVGTAPKDSGERSFEIISALRRWRFTTAARTPRAIALSAQREGTGAWEVDFYSQRAALAVRPRLHVSYLPLAKGGLP